jgi:hypothetical protein
MKGEIGRVVIYAEIDGEVKQVILPQERMLLLMQMAAGLSDDGELRVIEAPGMVFVEQKLPRASS